jgi:hypothetical protein
LTRAGFKTHFRPFRISNLHWSKRGFEIASSHQPPVTFLPQHAKSACHPVPAECQALLGETLRQLFAFACPSYPCSGFPEPTGALTTHRPLGSRNSSPMTYPSGCGQQYTTRARARKPPGNDSIFSVSLGRQRRTLGTRAPRELTSSVNVVSTWEADSCPEIWTATVIGILFSSRSIAKVCAIISLGNLAGSPPRRTHTRFFTDRPQCGPAPECRLDVVSSRTAPGPRHRTVRQSFLRPAEKLRRRHSP